MRRALPLLRLLAALLGPFTSPSVHAAAAEPPSLEIPVDCAIGEECFVQNHVDRDPGPAWRDFACGRLGYDGHRGTDFRVGDLSDMKRGVAVLAAADGVVLRVRDGMPDIGIRAPDAPDLAGKAAGNAVVIDHGDGWETQYSHLREHSVKVKPGDRVKAGRPLGLIGLSGNTEFPHVDFAVRHHGRVIDPYDGGTQDGKAPREAPREATPKDAAKDAPTCDGDLSTGLWSPRARALLPYRPSAILSAGFSADVPNRGDASNGAYTGFTLRADAPRLAFWAEVLGGRKGDEVRLRITGPGSDPDGRPLYDARATLSKPFAALFIHGVTPRPATGWPPGTYRGRVTLTHDGAVIVDIRRDVVPR